MKKHYKIKVLYTTNTTLIPSFNHCGLEKWPALNVFYSTLACIIKANSYCQMACLECLLQQIGLHHKRPQLLPNALMTFCTLYMISDVHKTVTGLSVSGDLTNTQPM